jgi:HemY protein
VRGLLWLLVLAALAVALSLLMRGNGGYALFVLPPWRVEVSLNFLVVLVVVGFVLLYFLVRVVWHALRLPSHVRAFRRRRRAEAGHEATLGAIQALFEGRFVRAEKLAAKAFDLGAARGLTGCAISRVGTGGSSNPSRRAPNGRSRRR